MAKQTVLFIRDHTVVHPATTLESVSCVSGERLHIADIAERSDTYIDGERIVFSSKKAALAFVKALGNACMLIPD